MIFIIDMFMFEVHDKHCICMMTCTQCCELYFAMLITMLMFSDLSADFSQAVH